MSVAQLVICSMIERNKPDAQSPQFLLTSLMRSGPHFARRFESCRLPRYGFGLKQTFFSPTSQHAWRPTYPTCRRLQPRMRS
jgi:hypothetical protein